MPTIEDLATRIKELEAQFRDLNKGYRLLDSSGRTRLSIFLDDDDNPILGLMDQEQRPRIVMGITDNPFCRMWDEIGKVRVDLSLRQDGSVLTFVGNNGEPCVDLGLRKTGPRIVFFDDGAKERVIAGCIGGVGGVNILDKEGIQRAALTDEE